MLNDEIEIMRNAFCFLRDHNDPPANDSGWLVAYWERTAFDMGRLAEKWSGHTLAVVVLAGQCEFLGTKAGAKTAAAGAGAGDPARTASRALAGGPAGVTSRALVNAPAGVNSRVLANAPAGTTSSVLANAPAGVTSRVLANAPAGVTSRGLANNPAGVIATDCGKGIRDSRMNPANG